MARKVVDQPVFLQPDGLFQEGGRVSLSGGSLWPADTARGSHLISNSCPRSQLDGFTKSLGGCANDAQFLDVD